MDRLGRLNKSSALETKFFYQELLPSLDSERIELSQYVINRSLAKRLNLQTTDNVTFSYDRFTFT